MAAAGRIGTLLAVRGCTMVYGGGKVGMMGEVANAALAHGGEVISIIPDYLRSQEIEHTGVRDRRVVSDLFQRKGDMMASADAFLTLPGGMGTYDELFEVLTWRQLGQLPKPVALLDINAYFAPLLTLFEHTVAQGYLGRDQIDHLIVDSDADRVIDRLLVAVREQAQAD